MILEHLVNQSKCHFWAVTCVERKRSKVLEVGTAIPLIKAKELNKDIGAMVM